MYTLMMENKNKYNRRNLELRAADFYTCIRKPKGEWKTIVDLAPQFYELEHRLIAEDYDEAARILELIDYDYLFQWGYYTKLLVLYEKIQGNLESPYLQATSLYGLGRAKRALGQVKEAIKLYELSLAIARKHGDRKNENRLLGRLGIAYRAIGEITKAFEFHKAAWIIAHEINDRRNEGDWRGNIGFDYYIMGLIKRSIKHYNKALDIAREIGDRWHESIWINYLGCTYRDLGETKYAITLFKEGLDITREIGDRPWQSVHLNDLGQAYQILGHIQQAIEYCDAGVAIAREIGYRQQESVGLMRLGIANLIDGKIYEAQRYLNEALSLNVLWTAHRAELALGIALLHQRDENAGCVFMSAITRCKSMLDKSVWFFPSYVLATALVGQAVCNPRWVEKNFRPNLLAPALAEYRRALKLTDARGVIDSAWRNLKLISAAGIEGLDPVFALLEHAKSRGNTF